MARASELPQINSRRYMAVMSAVALVACVALGFALVSSSIQGHKYAATVTIGPSGYVPQILSVKPHTLVTFENLTAAARSVKTSLPAPDFKFGSLNSISPNGAYTFIFNKSGTYQFHDSVNPLLNGTVIVQ